MKKIALVIACIAVLILLLPGRQAQAQAGMTATAILLVTDLINAGFQPTIIETGGTFRIRVNTTEEAAPTAATVNSFAVARSVTAKVLAVQFQ